jgi:hypothetical protein
MISKSIHCLAGLKDCQIKTRNKMRVAYQKDARGVAEEQEIRLRPQLQCLDRRRVRVSANRVGRLTQTLLE